MPSSSGRRSESFALSPGIQFLVLAGIVFYTFGAALNNGFISDDFVVLERAESFLRNPLYLFSIPPENFRTLTYVFFLILKRTVGFRPEVFYLVTLLFHALNAYLFSRLLQALGLDTRFAFLAALLFAAFQRPHEALVWLAGSNELFQGTALLLFLLAWFKERRGRAVFFYALALLTKESAPIGLLLLIVAMKIKGEPLRWRNEFLALGGLTVLHGLLLWALWDSNSLIAGGFYSLSLAPMAVLLGSLHRLALPWFYAFLLLALVMRSRSKQQLGWWVVWTVTAHLPYLFLTYLDHLPSRHQYLASLGWCAAMAVLIYSLPNRRLQAGLVVVFLIFNAGYIWLRKDAQFELRAAPTSRILEVLERQAPQELRLTGFPLNPTIAKLTTRLVDGWDPSHIRIAEAGETCQSTDCPEWVWSEETASYSIR